MILLRYVHNLCLAAATVALLLATQARAISPTTEKIYNLSSLEQTFLFFSHMFIDQGVSMGRNELPDNEMSRDMLDRLEQGLRQKYAQNKVRQSVFIALERELAAKTSKDILTIMTSDIWQRAVELEKRAHDPNNLQKRESYIANHLQSENLRPVRLKLIQELVKARQAVTLTKELMIIGSLGAAEILMGKDRVPAQFEQSMRLQMNDLHDEYIAMVTGQLLYTYRFLKDEQLKAYVDFYKTPAIQSLNRAFAIALTEAMR